MRKNESTNPTSRTFPDQRSPLMRMSQGWMSLSCQRLDMYKFSPTDSLIALDALLVNGSVKDLQDAMVRRHPGVQGSVPSGHQDSRDGDGKKPVFHAVNPGIKFLTTTRYEKSMDLLHPARQTNHQLREEGFGLPPRGPTTTERWLRTRIVAGCPTPAFNTRIKREANLEGLVLAELGEKRPRRCRLP